MNPKLVLLACIAVIALAKFKEEEADWERWNTKYGNLKVHSKKSKAEKKANFEKNVQKVRELNSRKDRTWESKLGPFADMDETEFLETFASGRKPASEAKGPKPKELPSFKGRVKRQAPESWDIRKDGPGSMTPVRNQGSCGSCWAFAAVATVENAMSVFNGTLPLLSEQDLVDCDSTCYGCNGGWSYVALNHVKTKGIASRDAYPYQNSGGTCKPSVARTSILDAVKLPPDSATIKSYLAKNGSCTIPVFVSGAFQYYSSGVFDDGQSYPASPDQTNHEVTLIGYGTEGGVPYWLIRNSWGPEWGEAGHIKVKARDDGVARLHDVYCPTFGAPASNVVTSSTTSTTTSSPPVSGAKCLDTSANPVCSNPAVCIDAKTINKLGLESPVTVAADGTQCGNWLAEYWNEGAAGMPMDQMHGKCGAEDDDWLKTFGGRPYCLDDSGSVHTCASVDCA
jgi:cathepsin L